MEQRLGAAQNHIEVRPGKHHLWIACAGIEHCEVKHFEQSYLNGMLPPVFRLPQMEMPLRNTKQTLAMAGLKRNTDVKELSNSGGPSTNTNPVYNVPKLMIAGIEGKQFLVKNREDADEVESAVEAACKDVFGRTGGYGFPILLDCWYESKIRIAKRGVERAGATALVYTGLSKERCSEAEVEEWLRRRRNGEEKRCLIIDSAVSRGWEASHALVFALYRTGLENLVMRTVGYCALVKGVSIDSDIDSDSDLDLN